MGRISEEAQNDVQYYTEKLDDKYNIHSEYPRIADIFNNNLNEPLVDLLHTRAEVDAIACCISYILEDKDKYRFSLVSAPRDPNRRAKAYATIVNDTNELKYMKQMEPLISQTISIKHKIIDDITFILKNANIGKNRRKKIIPMLISNILYDGEN